MTSSPTGSSAELRRNELSTAGVVFLVLAAAAPLTAVVATVPLSIALGNGIGTPGAYALAGVVLLLFAVGYVAMSRHVTNTGAFYAYVSKGLGRPLGVVAAMIALIAYNAMMVAVVALVGVFANQVFLAELGLDLPWHAWSAIAIALVAVLGYFEIHLSSRILGVALVLEIAALAVLDVGILVSEGPGAFPVTSFAPGEVFAGAAGVSVMYAFASFVGFESTAIYGEEAREPRRTVPRATYIAIGIIAIFYGLTTWALIAGARPGSVVAAAGEDPANFVFALNEQFVGGFTVNLMNLLIVTSSFAALLAFHNAASRYMFGLARDGLLPERLSRTHPKHGSPVAAGAAQIAIAVVVVAGFAAAGLDPLLELAAAFLGLGTLGIILLQALASFSVVGFFRERPDRKTWNTLVAPLLGGAGLSVAAALVVANYSSLTGAESQIINNLWWLHVVAGLAGLALAAYLRSNRPARFAALGEDHAVATVESAIHGGERVPVDIRPART